MMRVLVPTWQVVEPGEDPGVEPLVLDDRAAESLSQALSAHNIYRRRYEMEMQNHNDTRNELRSLANQLDEVRSHRDTLNEQARFLRRQVAWLERELRDANRERRCEHEAPSPVG